MKTPTSPPRPVAPPEGKLLDNPDLYPLYDAAQSLELPLLAHGGTSRPPYGPGSFDLDGAWFLLHSFSNPWAGMAALGALIGGGVFDMFPTLRVGIIETGGGWLPLALDRLDTVILHTGSDVDAVLDGADETLWRCRPALIAVEDDDAAVERRAWRLRAYGYRCWRLSTPRLARDGDAGNAFVLVALPEEREVSGDWPPTLRGRLEPLDGSSA